jgi:single-strand DNA-binding protein
MDAQISITGRVGSDVELRTVSESLCFARFRLGSTPRSLKDGEWVDGETIWISVECSRSLAKNAHASLRKGDPVVVVGKLRTHRWSDESGASHEDLRLQAVSLGHDLIFGKSTFERSRTNGWVTDDADETEDR